ncbi:MAG: hypothetical protein A2729_03975 [Candidatus Buchananbacteria bacterium RIFCSPHIGHO2_01_FULL_39_14]|uniref:Uncharacterized protein n=2 Tax=Candidatus Buchananiibacteriota TaxID=1817903 RepID=A0A1G1YUK9_9BACT|nr:MAG: hypothetical protein A2729_03975 [Candidatus Buchananbacteria bacterium RIFCSPHIGHO2_01_FULL_39_14]OGY48626.1 MAG: hypothetical protein A3D39_05170 [Candidatus Buchananbacteria bacterium RIFCSPHIGHO2_02_FULL_39_17]OGY56051.1 MAG: hypothetical protein A2912_03550 [Candidatus Buchananbacteria bacterium RIFCSPLOWO2_01_FULL_40_23b]
MKNKKISTIISIIVLLVVVGLLGYYFWPKTQPQDQLEKFFEFKIVKTDLTDWEKDKFTKEFMATKDALRLDPEGFQIWLNLGWVKKAVGDYRGAEEIWLYVNKTWPLNSVSFNNLGDLYANFMNEYDKAEAMFKVAIQNSKGEAINWIYVRSLFDLYVKTNQLDKAENMLIESLTSQPDNYDFNILLAGFYRDFGQKEKALQYYQKALVIKPDNEVVRKEIEALRK